MDRATLLLIFVVCGARRIVSPAPLTTPVISLDQPTGLYVVGEMVTITCTVTGDYHKKTFYFYKDNGIVYLNHNVRRDNIGTLPVTSKELGGRYQCKYWTSVHGRRLESYRSESVTVTIADPLTTPVISLDQATGVYIVGETVTMTCTVTGDYRENTFHFYKDNQFVYFDQIVKKDNIGIFPINSTDDGGRYQCQYGTPVKARLLESHRSESVTVTVADPPSPPGISLDQRTGVYLEGETVTITCTVNREDQGQIYFYNDNHRLNSHQIVTKDNIGAFPVTGTNQGGRYQCRYKTSVERRWLLSQFSEAVTVTIADPLKPPAISIDQPTGVYQKGKTVTITCTVNREDQGQIYFYKDNQRLNSHQIITKGNIGIFPVTGTNQGGQYQCRYRTSVKTRPLLSQISDAVTVTIAGLPKPIISADSSVAVKGGNVTFNCTISRELPGFTFYLYRHGEKNYSDDKPAAAGSNFVTFTINNIDHTEGGNYSCLYKGNVEGKQLTSALSDPVHITVRGSYLTSCSISIRLCLAAFILFGILIILRIECKPIKAKKHHDGDVTAEKHSVQKGDEETAV